jgi:predicted MFS family arabinose efflux permease
VGLFLFYLTFEFVIVCTIPLMTELAPKARATLLAANGAGHSLGRMLGSLIGPALFVSGLWTNALVAVVLNLVALVLLWAFIHEDAPHKAG